MVVLCFVRITLALTTISEYGGKTMKLLCNEIFGQNLQRIRNSCEMTQEQTVAQSQVLGSPISRSTYSLIELGRGNIYVSDLVGLQKVFHVAYGEFFEGISTGR